MSSHSYDADREVSCICVGHKGEYVRDPECPVCAAEEEPEPEPVECPACPQCGGETAVLGVLGRRVHFRCRACGWDCSERAA